MTHNTNKTITLIIIYNANNNLSTTDCCRGNRSAFRANSFKSSYLVRIKSWMKKWLVMRTNFRFKGWKSSSFLNIKRQWVPERCNPIKVRIPEGWGFSWIRLIINTDKGVDCYNKLDCNNEKVYSSITPYIEFLMNVARQSL